MEVSTFPVPHEKFTIICTYVGYKRYELQIDKKDSEIEIPLDSDDILLEGVTITARNPGRTEAGARAIEKQAMNVVNVMSAKAIELSPDITVANVIQRMSGVTIERNSSGEGQYAILRGMDKRYNYTLVNGVKIPSPDNKNRFVPLDIFPSEMLDRLEVTKSLTANLEGDGIGGSCQPCNERRSVGTSVHGQSFHRIQCNVPRARLPIVWLIMTFLQNLLMKRQDFPKTIKSP